MSRQREDSNDLAMRIKRMESRIRTLEQQLRATSTAIRSGRFVLIDASLTLTDDPSGFGPGTRGNVLFQPYSANDDEGYALRVVRAAGMGGQDAVQITTVDGSVTGDSFTSNVQLVDKKGGSTVVADSAGHRRGMADPRLQVPWYIFPDQLKSSTSSTFADIAGFKWYAYHPHLRIELIVQNDAATVSEVEVRDPDGNLFSELTFNGGTNAFLDLPEIRREDLINDDDGVNGNPQNMVVRHRRVSGAGTVRTMVTSIVGIDLSLFD